MRVHILGICGTFMGGVAALAQELGHQVSGSDQDIFPPMSDLLEALGVELNIGYSARSLVPAPDRVIVGNALSRGNPAIEHLLNHGLDYRSGPQWLAEEVLCRRRVLAVAGTHGKTTTASMAAVICERAGLEPGFLIGGAPLDFAGSARLGRGAAFVVEADEYDSAFFDKRSKFVHYRPEVAILNNLEYDHADIFPDLAAIQRQFHQLLRTVPARGRLIVNGADPNLAELLAMGSWTPIERFGLVGSGCEWQVELRAADASALRFYHRGEVFANLNWQLLGQHNALNALAAIAASAALGVDPQVAAHALAGFRGVKRRLEVLWRQGQLAVYDDFAHHPTAISETLSGLRRHVGSAPIRVVLEPRSNSMRAGVHAAALPGALAAADRVDLLVRPELGWQPTGLIADLGPKLQIAASVDALLSRLLAEVGDDEHVVFMSNGGFENLPQRFVVARKGAAGNAASP